MMNITAQALNGCSVMNSMMINFCSDVSNILLQRSRSQKLRLIVNNEVSEREISLSVLELIFQ